MLKILINILLCIISGAAFISSAEPVNIPWLSFISYVPLLFVFSRSRSFWELLLYSWLSMFVQMIIGFQWIHFVAMEFGFLSWWQAFGVLILFSLLTNFYLQIFASLYWLSLRLLKGNKPLGFYLFVIPGIFTLAELLDPKIFNWYAGNLIADYKYMFQFASVFGVSGISFLIMLVNVLLFLAVKELMSKTGDKGLRYRKLSYLASGIALIFLFLNLYGYRQYRLISQIEDACPRIRAGVVQANIGNPTQLKVNQATKLRQEFPGEEYKSHARLIMKKYKSMTEKLLDQHDGIDLVVWPETAFPGYYVEGNPIAVRTTEWQKEIGVPFLIGGYYLDYNGGSYYNSAILIDDGRVDFYHKNLLLPFGEYMPLSNIFPSLKNIVPAVGDFSKGDGPGMLSLVLNGLELRFAPAICYEILKPRYVKGMLNKDSQVFLNLSNDSWFGTIEPYQHLKIARAKAVEFRRPIIRSTNTGITSLIDMKGSVVKSGPLNKEEVFIFDVPICDHRLRTLYADYGFLFPWLLGIFIVLYIYKIRRKIIS